MPQRQPNIVDAGAESYERWRAQLLADPEARKIYDEEAPKMELWLRLVEARQAAGLTLKQMAKRLGVCQMEARQIERYGNDFCSLDTLQHYAATLMEDAEDVDKDDSTKAKER